MIIRLKDGSEKEYPSGQTVLEIAGQISPRLAKAACAAKINGKLSDIRTPINSDSDLEIYTFENEEGRIAFRHTASHILAQAVKRLNDKVELAIGPAIDSGFYYDFDREQSFSVDELESIENEMQKIIQEDLPLERFELPRDEALKLCEKMGESYKVQLIQDLPENETISFYKQGEFTDLCAGPHMPSTGYIKNIKLLSVAGAYWRGDVRNKMLQRIYGTAFEKKAELEAYLHMLEEAKKRDHRKLGKELDLFSLHDEGPGFPFFHPKGMVIRNTLEDYWRKIHAEAGYQEIKTPIILNRDLWLQSGHWDHYKDNMYFTKIDEGEFAVKPMNCPGAMLMYKRRIYSYKDLPLRLCEMGLVHRHEASGALHGLMRVRCFTQDDAHHFLTKDMIQQEVLEIVAFTMKVYSVFGFKFSIELSTRPENSMGSDEDWNDATEALRASLEKGGLEYKVNEGDGAFYGPKIDFHLEDCLGRTWQCGTIQLDFQMPERFDLHYIGQDGEKHRPVMIHRVVFGSIERFIGILTEHFAAAFPAWVAPVQVKVLSITERTADAAVALAKELNALGFRAESDIRNEKIGFKIREAQMEKIPYMLLIGDKEMENGMVSLRSRKDGDLGTCSKESFVSKLREEIDTKSI